MIKKVVIVVVVVVVIIIVILYVSFWQDVLENDDIQLDWVFKYSLMNDIVEVSIYHIGMEVCLRYGPLCVFTMFT